MKFLNKIKKVMEDIIPKIEIEEVAMAFHNGRLVPLCGVHELGGYESPDAFCLYRVILWMGKGWCPSRIGDPYLAPLERIKSNVKENKAQQRKDKRQRA